MKKLILSGLLLATIGITTTGCKKENVEIQHNQNQITENEPNSINNSNIGGEKYPGLKIENGILEFKTIEYYESIVDNSEGSSNDADNLALYLKSSNFNSFAKIYPESQEIDDSFVVSILNKDRVVKIGDWLFLINKPLNQVLVIDNKINKAYTTLLEGESRDIKIFSTDDDILEELKNPDSNFDRGCNESNAPTNNVPHSWDTYCSNFKFKVKAAYYTIGIYKKLRLEFWHKQKSGNDNNTLFSLGYRYKWKKKCKNEDADVTKPMTLWDFQGDHIELKFYTGSKSLSKYYIGGQNTGGATAAYKSRCTGYTNYQTLVTPLNHGY